MPSGFRRLIGVRPVATAALAFGIVAGSAAEPRFSQLALGERQVVDLVAVAGFYVMVSSVIIAGEIGIPNGGAPPLPTLMKK